METEEIKDEALETSEEEALETLDDAAWESEEEDTTDWKAEAEKARVLANNQKIRAEKAEKLAKTVKVEAKPQKVSGDLSTKDIYALMEAKVPESDIEKVQDIAKLKGISVSEALKLSLTKQILADESEQRQTASAANVGSTKRGSGKVSDGALMSEAEKGNLPDNDADFERLFKLRKGIS